MKCVVILAAAAMAGSAGAQVGLDLSVRFYNAGTGAWQREMARMPGSVVRVGVWMTGPAELYGMGGATVRLRISGAGLDDTAVFAAGTQTGRVGPFNFGPATNAIFRDSATGFRIDAASDAADSNANAGLTFFQRDPMSAVPGTFSRANPALCFRFDYTLGNDLALETRFDLDQLGRGVAGYFTSSDASRPESTSAVSFRGALIYAPAPGVLALAGLAACGPRRRRA